MIPMLRRATAVVGLVALYPIAFGLATGSVSARDAGIRALITFAAVVVARRLIGYLRLVETMRVARPTPAAAPPSDAGAR